LTIKNIELKISTERAFESISINVSGIQRLAKKPKNRILLESFGINPDNFIPVVAAEISVEQWIRVLQFYAKKCEYQPARDILAGLKKIILGRI
jgi:hypothetical protein